MRADTLKQNRFVEGLLSIWKRFSADTTYFGSEDKTSMINFRVRSLDAMVLQLRGLGVSVEVDPESYPNARFARLYDLAGNPIELWEQQT